MCMGKKELDKWFVFVERKRIVWDGVAPVGREMRGPENCGAQVLPWQVLHRSFWGHYRLRTVKRTVTEL